MNAPRSLRTRYGVDLLALALISLTACGLPSRTQGSADHRCADLVAQATRTPNGQSVPGLWACLDASLQRSINAAGQGSTSNPDSVLSIGVATATPFIGGNADFANYELILSPEFAAQAGTKWVELTVWLDPSGSGKVDNVGIPRPAF